MDNFECIIDITMDHISNLIGLTQLIVPRSNITDNGLKRIATLSNLQQLDISRCNCVTDVGIIYISDLIELTWLSVAGYKITNNGLKYIVTLANLEYLDL